MDAPVERAYPHVTAWVKDHGWIEIGYDDFSRSFIRVLNIGGMIWEGQESYASLDEALRAAEHELEVWIRKEYGG